MKKWLLFFLAAIVIIVLGLLLTGYRVLVSERLVTPGNSFVVEGYGDLGKSSSASLVCQYFTGRGIKTVVYWHSSNNVIGRDECPFLSSPGE